MFRYGHIQGFSAFSGQSVQLVEHSVVGAFRDGHIQWCLFQGYRIGGWVQVPCVMTGHRGFSLFTVYEKGIVKKAEVSYRKVKVE